MPASPGKRLAGEAASEIEEGLDTPDSHRAGLSDDGVEDPVRSGQGASVGGHRPSALHRATGLEEHDRLSGCGLGEGTAEVPAISDALEIENDEASLGVLGRRFSGERSRRPRSLR